MPLCAITAELFSSGAERDSVADIASGVRRNGTRSGNLPPPLPPWAGLSARRWKVASDGFGWTKRRARIRRMVKQFNSTEEDGEDVFTPMPTLCTVWRDSTTVTTGGYCNGKVVVQKGTGFHVCEKCGVSYGK